MPQLEAIHFAYILSVIWWYTLPTLYILADSMLLTILLHNKLAVKISFTAM